MTFLRRVAVGVAVLSALATPLRVAAQTAAADTARWLGPWLNVHYTYAGGTSMDGDVGFTTLNTTTSSSSGAGLGFGYTFLPWLGIFGNADVAPGQTITSTTVTGSQTLYQLDAGVRAQLPMATFPLLIYGELGFSTRILSGTAQVQGLSPTVGNDYSNWGGAAMYGFGAQFLVGRRFAVDASYLASSGTYAWVKMANIAPLETHASSSKSSRVLVGVTWYLRR
jgi:hypothetical protein